MLSFFNKVANQPVNTTKKQSVENPLVINNNQSQSTSKFSVNNSKCLINKGDMVTIITATNCEIARKYNGFSGTVIEVARRQKKNMIFLDENNKEIRRYELSPQASVQVEIYINNVPMLIQTDIGNLKLDYALNTF